MSTPGAVRQAEPFNDDKKQWGEFQQRSPRQSEVGSVREKLNAFIGKRSVTMPGTNRRQTEKLIKHGRTSPEGRGNLVRRWQRRKLCGATNSAHA
jgi:hypothetical protein